jgi:hypothetical protein
MSNNDDFFDKHEEYFSDEEGQGQGDGDGMVWLTVWTSTMSMTLMLFVKIAMNIKPTKIPRRRSTKKSTG